MSLSGEEPITLATGLAGLRKPSWSPDGRSIAFYSTESGSQDIWIVRSEASAPPRQATEGAAEADDSRFTPSWSPDGRFIAYVSNRADWWHDDVAAFQNGDFERATAEFRSLVTQNPEHWVAHYLLGLSLERLQRTHEALRHLRTAHQINPHRVDLRVALARFANGGRHYAETVALLGNLDLDSLPTAVRSLAYQLRGTANQEQGKTEAALDDFAKEVELETTNAESWHRYGVAAFSAGRLEIATDALTKASQLATKSEDLELIWRQLGHVYERQKNFDESIEAYRRGGDDVGEARARENAKIARENRHSGEHNSTLQEMAAGMKRSEDGLKAPEEGTAKPPPP